MQKRKNPRLKLSLLSCAIAFAATGSMQAQAVDLCTGKTSTTVSSGASGNNCSLDTANAKLTVNAGGKITDGVSVTQTGVTVSNAGLIATSSQTALYYSGDLDKSLSNSGTIRADGYDAYAVNISGDVSGTINNSGRMIGVGMSSSYVGGSGLYIDGGLSGKLTNSGRIEGTAIADSY